MFLPKSWIDLVEAPPGTVLVERDEIPRQMGGLWLPEGYRGQTLCAAATVKAVGRGVFDLKVGDHVLLAAGVGKAISFGVKEERMLWRALPSQVVATLSGGAERPETLGAHPFRNFTPSELHEEPLAAVDEGDPRALR